MNMKTEQPVKKIISKMRQGLRKCKTISDYVNFAYSFRLNEHSIEQLQIKNEVRII